jgi:inositol transport system ATP-binding protein
MSETILRITNLSKSFSGIKALDHVQLTVEKGEVHALMGENGAGKSTFMKILAGLIAPDAGEIIWDGQVLKNPGALLRKEISMIHQEILLVPQLTVAQNIFLGKEKEVTKGGRFWLHDKTIRANAGALLEDIGVDINTDMQMKRLSVAQMQMVEIAKALSNKTRVIIMDEPTSAISDKEVALLFNMIKKLKSRGVAIIYISHKMDEIFQIADTVTILRDGQYIATKKASEFDRNSLINMMVGREISQMFPESVYKEGKPVLSVKNLCKKGKFSDISFAVHAGEILGIAGLMGAGRTEIAQAIYGLIPADSGKVYVDGEEVMVRSPHDALKSGIGYVSEDRKGFGFMPRLSVKHNLTMGSLPKYRPGLFKTKPWTG